jgi:hypothetical protein
MVTIKFSNKTFLLLLTGLLLVLASGLTIAWNSNNPAVHGHTANEISGMPAGEGGGISVCVSFYRKRSNSNPTFIGSSNGQNFPASEVVQVDGTATGIDCKSGWIMTGCGVATDGSDEDDPFKANGCAGDVNSGQNTYIRCCK